MAAARASTAARAAERGTKVRVGRVGSLGHKANECAEGRTINGVGEEEEATKQIGGVWTIGQVAHAEAVETSNRFEAFVEEDKDFAKVEDAVRLPQSNGCYTEKVKGHVDFKKKMTMTRDGWMKIDKSKKRRKQKNAK